ncbi:MAG TPA: hypothetical protein VGN52_25780 [Burkholderiales bacterium]
MTKFLLALLFAILALAPLMLAQFEAQEKSQGAGRERSGRERLRARLRRRIGP